MEGVIVYHFEAIVGPRAYVVLVLESDERTANPSVFTTPGFALTEQVRFETEAGAAKRLILGEQLWSMRGAF